jgi:hypothetical protein
LNVRRAGSISTGKCKVESKEKKTCWRKKFQLLAISFDLSIISDNIESKALHSFSSWIHKKIVVSTTTYCNESNFKVYCLIAIYKTSMHHNRPSVTIK